MSGIIYSGKKVTIIKGTSVGPTTYLAEHPIAYCMDSKSNEKYFNSVPDKLITKWENKINKLIAGLDIQHTVVRTKYLRGIGK